MDLESQLRTCFINLGYVSTFPKKLPINPHTSYIWQQFISKVKPKNEVEQFRKTIIINRLNGKKVLTSLQYEIPEIEAYNRLKRIRDQISVTKSRILEKREKEARIRAGNKAKYVSICDLNQKIKIKNAEKRLTKLKISELEAEISRTEAMLGVQGLSGVPNDASLNPKLVKEFLEEKIAKLRLQNHKRNVGKSTFNCFLDQSDGLLPEHCFKFEDDEKFLTAPENLHEFPDETLHEIYRKTNTETLWNVLCTFRDSLFDDIRSDLHKISFVKNVQDENDAAILNYTIVRNSLQSLKARKELNLVKNEIRRRKNEIRFKFGEHYMENLERILDKIGEKAGNEFIDSCFKELGYDEVQETRIKLETIQGNFERNLSSELEKIREISSMKTDLFKRIVEIQKRSLELLENVGKFTWGPTWAEILTQGLNNAEMKIFDDFPFSRSSMEFPGNFEGFGDSLPGYPYARPELILTNLQAQNVKLEMLKKLDFPELNVANPENVSLEELENREKYVGEIVESLQSHVKSRKSLEIHKNANHIKQCIDLWLEMPFKRYISRKIDGKTYQEYEDEYVVNKF